MKQFLFVALVALFASCNGSGSSADTGTDTQEKNTEKELKLLKEEVMAAHNRVMPASGPMGTQQMRLRELAATSPDSVYYIRVALDLKSAQDQMMTWMHEFQSPDEQNWDATQKAEYLKEEKAKMIEIEKYTFNTMHLADSIIEANKNPVKESK